MPQLTLGPGDRCGFSSLNDLSRMPSSEMLHCVALVRTDVSEERSASIIRVTRIVELGILAVTSNRHKLHSISSQHALVASYG
jgi:hypothetical protein